MDTREKINTRQTHHPNAMHTLDCAITGNNNIVASNGAVINIIERSVIFECKKGENEVRLIFPHEAPCEVINRLITTILQEGAKRSPALPLSSYQEAPETP
jgi:hypothetical protein